MADGFSREISRVVAGQLAEVAGYESVQDSAAEVLGELLIKYITELSASSHGYAELANRTAINVHDILLALDDLGTSVPELQNYLSSLTTDDNTFAHPLPQYPIQKPGRKLPTFQDKKETPPPHIPPFLPAFPDKHTYVQTPKFPGHEQDPAKQTQMVQQARRQAEKSLVKLHYSLTNPGQQGLQDGAPAGPPAAAAGAGVDGAAATTSAAPGVASQPAASAAGPSSPAAAAAAAAGTSSTNPFLAPPGTVVLPPGATQAQMPWVGLGGPQGAGGHLGGGGPRHAFVPDAALHAFKAVLPAEATGGAAAAQGAQDTGDVAAPEEDMETTGDNPVYQGGVQKEPLGSVHDYATRAYSAAQAASSGRVAGDAYEKAAAKAAEEAAAASGARASRHPKDPKYEYERRKHPAEEILDAGSLDVDRAMEGEDE
uniref:Transcription initiation factor TFIID subunit 8 n=1 Tax=Dunaliella tertiolecta TaxID=3047 RepID=A0A6S8IU36_DUNTE